MDIEFEVEKCFLCPASGIECGLVSVSASNSRIANQMQSLRISVSKILNFFRIQSLKMSTYQFPNYLDFMVCSQCARQLSKLDQLQRNLDERLEFIQCVVDKNVSFLQKRNGLQEDSLHQEPPQELQQVQVRNGKDSLAHYAVVKMEPTEGSLADNYSTFGRQVNDGSQNLDISCEQSAYERRNTEHPTAKGNKMIFKKGNCEVCKKFFKNPTELRVHYNAVHLKIRKFKCKLCGYTFSKNFNLLRHVKSVHADERVSHICQTCGVSFKLDTQLARHMRSHAGEFLVNQSFCVFNYFISRSEPEFIKLENTNKPMEP